MYDRIGLSYRTIGGDLVYPPIIEVNRILEKHISFNKAQFNKNKKKAMDLIKPIKKDKK